MSGRRPTVERFRKKPIEIEAMQFVGENSVQNNAMQIVRWVLDGGGRAHYQTFNMADGRVVISTPEGDMEATLGYWIIRGVQGEFYPCKADIFAATYEQVSAG